MSSLQGTSSYAAHAAAPAAMTGKNTSADGEMKDETRTRIGQQLRVMYGDLMNQGIPDRLSDLLRRLDDDEMTSKQPPAPRSPTPRVDGRDDAGKQEQSRP